LIWAIAGGVLTIAVLIAIVPRRLIARAQDRLAAERIAREGQAAFQLLTRAERVAGRYRRIPGILALREERLEFSGLHEESEMLPMARVQKIATGQRLASGRMLFRQEVLRLTRTSGDEVEFVLSPDSAHAWRSHLGLWAGRERQAAAERVTPGR
jgi:hypothetical protein